MVCPSGGNFCFEILQLVLLCLHSVVGSFGFLSQYGIARRQFLDLFFLSHCLFSVLVEDFLLLQIDGLFLVQFFFPGQELLLQSLALISDTCQSVLVLRDLLLEDACIIHDFVFVVVHLHLSSLRIKLFVIFNDAPVDFLQLSSGLEHGLVVALLLGVQSRASNVGITHIFFGFVTILLCNLFGLACVFREDILAFCNRCAFLSATRLSGNLAPSTTVRAKVGFFFHGVLHSVSQYHSFVLSNEHPAGHIIIFCKSGLVHRMLVDEEVCDLPLGLGVLEWIDRDHVEHARKGVLSKL
mmetsp:Transcript_61793/g.127763  ORF Transcript_61793/g.127763 Transcript_61793/m.127763 type:complete len:297 (-) Transcript_61793:508-1398(-)